MPLRASADAAIQIADTKNTILVSNSISEVVGIAKYAKSAFLLHNKNTLSLFQYSYEQFKNRTLEEFKIILFAGRKNMLYFLLKAVAFLSFGNYKLIYFKGDNS
jgi:hypothetical protein